MKIKEIFKNFKEEPEDIEKQKCKALREIRRQIAKKNNIEFNTSDCKYKGKCSETCPKCDEELLYLNSELKKRENAGKSVIIDNEQLSISFILEESISSMKRTTKSGICGDLITPELIENAMQVKKLEEIIEANGKKNI